MTNLYGLFFCDCMLLHLFHDISLIYAYIYFFCVERSVQSPLSYMCFVWGIVCLLGFAFLFTTVAGRYAFPLALFLAHLTLPNPPGRTGVCVHWDTGLHAFTFSQPLS